MQCEFARQFFEMLSAITAEQKTPKEYYGDKLLYRAEVELLEKIELYPNLNVSKLSNLLNVTKSAVTQICGKLIDKGLIEMYKDPKNKKEKYFRLTQQGKDIWLKHQKQNSMAAKMLCEYLRGLNEHEKKSILEFMQIMKKYLPLYSFNCDCTTSSKLCIQSAKAEGV